MVEPSRHKPALVGTGKILLEYQLAVADDDHGMNIGVGFLQPRRDAQSRAPSRPTLSGEAMVQPSFSAVGVPQAGLVSAYAVAIEPAAAKTAARRGAAIVCCPRACCRLRFRCYAGGGTEIFTDGRSSIF